MAISTTDPRIRTNDFEAGERVRLRPDRGFESAWSGKLATVVDIDRNALRVNIDLDPELHRIYKDDRPEMWVCFTDVDRLGVLEKLADEA